MPERFSRPDMTNERFVNIASDLIEKKIWALAGPRFAKEIDHREVVHAVTNLALRPINPDAMSSEDMRELLSGGFTIADVAI